MVTPEELAYACFELPRDNMGRVQSEHCEWALVPLDLEERVARAIRGTYEAGRGDRLAAPHEDLSTK